MKRIVLDRNDIAILELAHRYCKTLKSVEYAHAIDDQDDLEMILAGVDPVDVRMVGEHLERLWRRASLAPDVGTEPREGTDGSSLSQAEPLSECGVLRSSVPPSFFPESRRV